MKNKGATIWARQTIESDIFFWKPDKWFKIWFFLVNRVNHKDNKQFKRGSCFTTYKEIREYTGATKGQIDMCIRWLKLTTMITTDKTTRGMIVHIVKYNHFQCLDNYKTIQKTTTDKIYERNTNDTINKNDKNDKNVNTLQSKIASKKSSSKKPANGVNTIINLFHDSINPDIAYNNKTTRKATEELIKKYGLEETIKITKDAIEVQGKDYAPVITTPHELKTKLAKLNLYLKKDNKIDLEKVARDMQSKTEDNAYFKFERLYGKEAAIKYRDMGIFDM